MAYEIKTPYLKKIADANMAILNLALRSEADAKKVRLWNKRLSSAEKLGKNKRDDEAITIADEVMREIKEYKESI